MDLDNLTELANIDDGKFTQLAQDFAEQVFESRHLTTRSQALLKKKLNLNSKLGLRPPKTLESFSETQKPADRSEMAKNQAKDTRKRNSLSKKHRSKYRSHTDKRRDDHFRRDWHDERDWEKPFDRRSRKKAKFQHFTRAERTGIKMNNSKLLKIEGKKVRYNCNHAERFVLNKMLDLFENQFIEFKRLKGLHLQMILNYICGFLNSYGGSLYIGIADDGYVKGIALSRQDIDQFQVDLDRALRQFHPRVFPDQIRLAFHEIALNSRKQVGRRS